MIKAILIILLTASLAHGADYYVDPLNGNDANPGTQVSPRQTLTSARTLLYPGDTLYLLDTAVYSGTQGMYSYRDGTSTNPITIKAAPGAAPVFRGCGRDSVYFILSHKWHVIDGLTFEAPTVPGDCATDIIIDVHLTGDNNTVKNCIMDELHRDNGAVKITNGDYNTVENNTFINIGQAGASGFGEGEAVTIFGGTYNTVQGNTINGAMHTGIGVYNSSAYNQILSNIIDQGQGTGLNGGGGGIYVQVLSHHNTVQGNTIRNVGRGVDIAHPKSGLTSTANDNTFRNNTVESFGVEGSDLHHAIYLNSMLQFGNLHADNNLFEGNVVGAGYGVPVYVREGNGSRGAGVTVMNNVFRNNTFTAPIDAITSSSYIGAYTPTGKYAVYMGSYTDGAWPTFANGNTFEGTTWIGSGQIGYLYATNSTPAGGWSKSVAQAETDYPAVFYGAPPPPATGKRSVPRHHYGKLH